MNRKGKIGIKTDCFAHKDTGRASKCVALKELYCAKEYCPFYKKKETKER